MQNLVFHFGQVNASLGFKQILDPRDPYIGGLHFLQDFYGCCYPISRERKA